LPECNGKQQISINIYRYQRFDRNFEDELYSKCGRKGGGIVTEKLLKPSKVAELLSVDSYTVKKWCREGRVQAKKVQGMWRIPESEVYKLISDGGDEREHGDSGENLPNCGP
jgi:hypothetical protein